MQSSRNDIPAPAARRLSDYLRELESIDLDEYDTISSGELAHALGITSAQVRKDLTYLGSAGSPGIGYEIKALIKRIRKTLGTDKISNALLVGVGNIGKAIATYRGFTDKHFELVALFDVHPKKVDKKVGTIPILPLEKLDATIRKHKIKMAILTVPADKAQEVTDLLVKAGIRGILNFTPTRIVAPKKVTIRSLDVAAELEQLSFMIAQG